MTATPEAMADMAAHRAIEQRAMSDGFCVAEHAPTYTLEKMIAQARWEMGEARWHELNAEWLS